MTDLSLSVVLSSKEETGGAKNGREHPSGRQSRIWTRTPCAEPPNRSGKADFLDLKVFISPTRQWEKAHTHTRTKPNPQPFLQPKNKKKITHTQNHHPHNHPQEKDGSFPTEYCTKVELQFNSPSAPHSHVTSERVCTSACVYVRICKSFWLILLVNSPQFYSSSETLSFFLFCRPFSLSLACLFAAFIVSFVFSFPVHTPKWEVKTLT